MIHFERFLLDNGLRVLVHEDHDTPMAVVNVMYDVGARDEHTDRTGFAHLFEHLMFGGSKNIPDYDEPMQRAGGENNAYTTNDLTNYYAQLPAKNIETAFWLESDRMLELAFTKKSLNVQRKVVCEEFKEHYLNKPYGDIWHRMRNMCYQVHPYKWMTIGQELSHVEKASMDEVQSFFYKHYRPVNAILVVAGAVKTEEVKHLANKWFGGIPSGEKYIRQLPAEPVQTAPRHTDVHANVPANALIMAWHMDARLEPGYYAADLITEILGGGNSARLYQALVKEQKIFSALEVHHFGSTDKGLLALESRLVDGVNHNDARAALEMELIKLVNKGITSEELEKVKNKTESMIVFEDMSLTNRAASLAHYELLEDASLMNTELERYRRVTVDDIVSAGKNIFREENSNTMFYHAGKSSHA
ncbi:MAG: M16 family metallopeptidase [Sediminibacterium sp.]